MIRDGSYLSPEEMAAYEQRKLEGELAGNFTITDDDLGHGTAKEKFRKNMDAIRTLKAIETVKCGCRS